MAKPQPNRISLSKLTDKEKMDLSVLMQYYITDLCVDDHQTINHTNYKDFWGGHDAYLKKMEDFLRDMQEKKAEDRFILTKKGVYHYGDIGLFPYLLGILRPLSPQSSKLFASPTSTGLDQRQPLKWYKNI